MRVVNVYRALEPLRHIRRFSRHYLAAPQNVMEHSYMAALIGAQLAQQLDVYTPVDIPRVVEGCLWHDAAEAVTGDIPHDYKRSDPSLMKAWDVAEWNVQNDLELLSGGPRSPKARTVEAFLVKMADWMELLLYERSERGRGNTGIATASERIWKLLWTHLRDWIPDVVKPDRQQIVRDWYDKSLDELRGALAE